MPSKQDYYEILGVLRQATDKQIKQAYRRLARKYHPDVNKGEKAAEEKFKQVAEAFAVLSDPDKRAKYDRGGHAAFGAGFNPFAGYDPQQFEFGFGDISELFKMFGGIGGMGGFGGQRRYAQRAQRGADLKLELSIPFLEALNGTRIDLIIPRRGEGSERVRHKVKVRIPAGVDDGTTLRLTGRGDAGAFGGPAGDAYLTIRVEPHAVFRREGRDLYCDVPISLARAALGGQVSVPTPAGNTTIALPVGTKSGQRFRLKSKGVAAVNGAPPGDLFAVIQIHPPKRLNKRSRELLQELEELLPEP